MLIRIDPTTAEPVYDQLASALRAAIEAGEIRGGERLPSARSLAADLDLNLHTVLKAFALVRDEGLVDMRRGRQPVVVAPPQLPAAVAGALTRLVALASRQGVSRDQLVRALRAAP